MVVFVWQKAENKAADSSRVSLGPMLKNPREGHWSAQHVSGIHLWKMVSLGMQSNSLLNGCSQHNHVDMGGKIKKCTFPLILCDLAQVALFQESLQILLLGWMLVFHTLLLSHPPASLSTTAIIFFNDLFLYRSLMNSEDKCVPHSGLYPKLWRYKNKAIMNLLEISGKTSRRLLQLTCGLYF